MKPVRLPKVVWEPAPLPEPRSFSASLFDELRSRCPHCAALLPESQRHFYAPHCPSDACKNRRHREHLLAATAL